LISRQILSLNWTFTYISATILLVHKVIFQRVIITQVRVKRVGSPVKVATDYDQRHQSHHFRHSSPVSRAASDRRHLDDVIASYCDCTDATVSRCDVIRDVVLPTAFVRRRNERERQRVRYKNKKYEKYKITISEKVTVNQVHSCVFFIFMRSCKCIECISSMQMYPNRHCNIFYKQRE